MAEKIDFENGHFRNFDPSVTLTLTLDDLETYIIRFVSLSPIHTYIVYMGALSLIVDTRTDGRTDIDQLYEVSSTELTWKCEFSQIVADGKTNIEDVSGCNY